MIPSDQLEALADQFDKAWLRRYGCCLNIPHASKLGA